MPQLSRKSKAKKKINQLRFYCFWFFGSAWYMKWTKSLGNEDKLLLRLKIQLRRKESARNTTRAFNLSFRFADSSYNRFDTDFGFGRYTHIAGWNPKQKLISISVTEASDMCMCIQLISWITLKVHISY